MRLIDYFQKGLARGADRPAFVDDRVTLTYGEVDHRARRMASSLQASGLSTCPPIAVFSPNDPQAFACIIGILYAGGIWVPCNARNTVAVNAHFLSMTSVEVLFYHGSLAREAVELKAAVPTIRLLICIDGDGAGSALSLDDFLQRGDGSLPEVPDDPERLATIFPTGGTTGLSKGAPWTHRTWEALIGAYWHCMPSTTPPVHLVAGPMTHAAGGLALMMMPGGACNVVLPRADPLLIMQAIDRHRITHLYLPPTVLYMMLAHPEVRRYDYSSLKYFVLAAAPIAPEKLREAMDVFGPVMCQSFGQAEAPMFLTFLTTADLLAADGDGRLYASCGRPTLNVRVEIMDDAGTILPPGERGEIVAKGSLVFPGYYRNPEATAAASTHGWHHTGDIGYRDEQGFIYIVDRKKDMIVTGGFNVFSAEVEQVLLSHPAVRDCAVVGVPDAKWGEAIKAVIELKANADVDPQDLIDLVKRELGGVHAPKSVDFWDELPRSGNGKVLKRDVRDTFWSGRERAV
ncbi:acyl-CoA synthetase (AMP-forming)/AMP-acid ligase II [Rhodoligotrophos appendicifer]|uniref:class I adenylate-forming enzyme family protein n=1 Tax=Rhodoligotrophos appendicifer TaxID=987056 RepID=UPI00117DFE44|nr:AMP-binding protein [Rhodoligotrophos appendicifer]